MDHYYGIFLKHYSDQYLRSISVFSAQNTKNATHFGPNIDSWSKVWALNRGRAGVWDSPLATDRYVQKYGFLFGGGRSGVLGLRALQSLGQDRSTPVILAARPVRGERLLGGQELEPLTLPTTSPAQSGGKVVFNRFRAVPK